MLEIGVQSGGSIKVWKSFFNNKNEYTGIDINPNCQQFQNLTNKVKIAIGSQGYFYCYIIPFSYLLLLLLKLFLEYDFYCNY